MEKVSSLHDLFVMELKDVYDAELQASEMMPKMIQATSSEMVKARFEQHMKETKEQIERLHQVFKMLDMQPEREHCDGMAGILKDGQKVMEMQGDPATKDAALIAAEQKVEHYEISSYGTLRTYARTLGRNEIADLLQRTLDEESRTDEMLTQVAERSINKKAA